MNSRILQPEELEVRTAYARFRRYLRRLYACSTSAELLSVIESTAVSFFPEASYVVSASRLPDGCWSFHGDGIGRASRIQTFNNNREHVVAPIFSSDPGAADRLMCFPEKRAPGEIVTYDDYGDERSLARDLEKAYPEFKQLHESMVAAVIHSRSGFVAHVYLGEFRKSYDDDGDQAILSAIAAYASLADGRA
jgi:hypothetical protein